MGLVGQGPTSPENFLRVFCFYTPVIKSDSIELNWMAYYVYVLQSLKDHKYYIDSTEDVEARLRFHNAGLQRSTGHRIPFRLVYFEELSCKHFALMREKKIKNFKGGNNFKKLIEGK